MPKLIVAVTLAVAAGAVAASAGSADVTTSVNAKWNFAGPSTYKTRTGEDEPAPLAAAGAVQNVAKGSGSDWFIGSVNGGLWKSSNIGDAKPSWENVLDGQPVSCSSIAALHVSKTDPKRVYAGCGGSTSSEEGSDWNVLNSGEWTGVMSTDDSGKSWKMLKGFPVNYYVTDIHEVDEHHLLVSAQSNLFDRDDGGIWLSTDQGESFDRVLSTPTFNLLQWKAAGGALVATHTRDAQHSASLSLDSGKTWTDAGALAWAKGSTPFYTCATELKNGNLVIAGLTRSPGLPNNTDSQFFVKSPSENSFRTLVQPTSMDQDAMPKDRMAVLGDPSVDDLLYVAGNGKSSTFFYPSQGQPSSHATFFYPTDSTTAGALAYRVNTTTGKWSKMWDEDVVDGSLPHGDCRNFAWDPDNGGRVVLTSDGGVFARSQPRKAGGKWVSLNGDYASMELLSAHYNNREGTFVAGAQDNCAQLVKAKPTEVAVGFVEGDGTVTLVDNVANPARMFGTTQFMGVGAVDIDPQRRRRLDATNGSNDDDDDDDDDCGGLCFVQGNTFTNVPLTDYFPEPSNFPFFVQPYALNSQDPSRFVFWTNGTAGRRSAFYEFEIPYSVKTSKDIPAPREILVPPPGAFFLDFVSGGFTSGKPDPELIVGMSSSHLYVKNNSTGAGSEMVARELPMKFATPVDMIYDEKTPGKPRILGPVTHGRTVSLAVSPADSNVVAVTGWPSVKTNAGPERIFASFDAGLAWLDVTGDLREATGVVGKVRPGGLLIVDLVKNNDRALLTGTSNGVYVTFLDSSPGIWVRLGSEEQFPIVLTADLSFEHYSNKIVAATFGRGIYVFDNAKEALLDARDEIWNLRAPRSGERLAPRVTEESSARFFPEQL